MSAAGPATFHGWAFPGIPGNARLVHLNGSVALPAAGANADVDGAAPVGGTGLLVKRSVWTGRGAPVRCAVLAGGVALVDYAVTIPMMASVPAGGTLNLLTALGLTSATMFRHLRIEAGAAGLVLRTSNPYNLSALGVGAAAAADFYDVAVNSTWEFSNPGGADVNVWITASYMPEQAVRYVAAQLFVANLDQSGTVVGSVDVLPNGEGLPSWVQPLEGRGWPDLVPLAVPITHAELGLGQAYGVRVFNAAASPIPASARVNVRLVVAVWPAGAEGRE